MRANQLGHRHARERTPNDHDQAAEMALPREAVTVVVVTIDTDDDLVLYTDSRPYRCARGHWLLPGHMIVASQPAVLVRSRPTRDVGMRMRRHHVLAEAARLVRVVQGLTDLRAKQNLGQRITLPHDPGFCLAVMACGHVELGLVKPVRRCRVDGLL